MRIIVFGPPGSGKSTTADLIGEIYVIPVIRVGDLLREIASKKTMLGSTVKTHIQQGELVPDKIVNEIIKTRLEQFDEDTGFVLDGYPRDIAQANVLDHILERKEESIDHVIYIEVSDETVIRRLILRRVCPHCGSVYHLKRDPPLVSGICDDCGTELVQRSDDREEAIRHRLKVYKDATSPLMEWYRRQGKLKKTSGEVEVKEIPKDIHRLLDV